MREAYVDPIPVEVGELNRVEFKFFSDRAGECNYINALVFNGADEGPVAHGKALALAACYYFKLGQEYETYRRDFVKGDS